MNDKLFSCSVSKSVKCMGMVSADCCDAKKDKETGKELPNYGGKSLNECCRILSLLLLLRMDDFIHLLLIRHVVG